MGAIFVISLAAIALGTAPAGAVEKRSTAITTSANFFTLSQFLRASMCCFHGASNNLREMILTK